MATDKLRFAVVGAGWFGQTAVLPAFANSKRAVLAAIVSGDAEKRDELAKRYSVPAVGYEGYDGLLSGGTVDAVFIVLPNTMHADYTVRAARHGVHVLCEKPLAVTPAECGRMIDACATAGVKLMTAYRLHFEPSHLGVIEAIRGGVIGPPRVFHGFNTQSVEDEENIRLDADRGGGPLQDLGVYCVNAARYLFQADPVEVSGFAAAARDPRFREVPEMVSAVMRFPDDRLATFTCGFGEGKVSEFRVVGTKGDVRMDPAFSFTGDLYSYTTVDGKTKEKKHPAGDQVAAEIDHFAERVLAGEEPEPDGREGLIDVTVMDAIIRSVKEGRAVKLPDFPPKPRPREEQGKKRPPAKDVKMVNATAPDGSK
jgi:glucose-fructose oxidoreductase